MMKTISFFVLLACVVMFIVEMVRAGGFQPLEQNPMLGPDALTLARLGAGYGYRTQQKWEVYRLFAPVFLHGGVFHILGNMLFLVMMGIPQEQKWGWRQFSLILFVSGIGASLFSTCIRPNTISVGASGALFGVLGAGLADLAFHWSAIPDPSFRRMQLIQQVMFIIIWMMISFGSKYIDGWAHLGGLIFGFLLGATLWSPDSDLHPRIKTLGRPLAAALTIFTLLLMAGLFFGGVIETEQLYKPYY